MNLYSLLYKMIHYSNFSRSQNHDEHSALELFFYILNPVTANELIVPWLLLTMLFLKFVMKI